MPKTPLYLALSLDVEEEGLFCGKYRVRAPSVANVSALSALAPFYERGVNPTLFCAYSVFADAEARKCLEKARDAGAEIGAHLHYWNTPPVAPNTPDELTDVSATRLTSDVLSKKLESLFAAARDFQMAPVTSFRMGRWDIRRELWPALAAAGVKCDASVRPLHSFSTPRAGPDHFDAPTSPYVINTGFGDIVEIPLTVTPLVEPLKKWTPSRATLKNWGCLALLPIWHPLWLLKLTTKLFAARGGTVVSLTWHSSEMSPGGAPYMKDKATVTKFLNKTIAYVDWLMNAYDVKPARMDDLRRGFANAPVVSGAGDWTWEKAS